MAEISGLPEAFILWEREGQGPVDQAQDGRRLTLSILSRIPVGVDEETRVYTQDDEDPDIWTLDTTYSGQRSVTVSIKAENYGVEEGFDFLEKIRVMLGADTTRAQFNEWGTAVQDVGAVRTIQGFAGNRQISVAQMDLFLNQRVSIAVSGGDTFIETVEDADGEFYQ